MKRFALAALAVLVTSPVLADDWQRGFFGHSSTYHSHDSHRYVREQRQRYYDPPRYREREYETRRYYGPQVRGWVQGDTVVGHLRNIPVATCFSPVRTVGDQAITVEGAKTEAVKAWSQMVRHDHGERAMDFEVAREGSFACVRSSIGSVAGAVFHRCELIARPCTPTHIDREK